MISDDSPACFTASAKVFFTLFTCLPFHITNAGTSVVRTNGKSVSVSGTVGRYFFVCFRPFGFSRTSLSSILIWAGVSSSTASGRDSVFSMIMQNVKRCGHC
ncbi:hypothetical protein BCY90_03135 [Agrobacterium deltaense]|nr:hypothetical protein BCY90_03135 [Agrobacterium deltaense]